MNVEQYREIERLLDDDAALLHILLKDSVKGMFELSLLKGHIDEDDEVQNLLLDESIRHFAHVADWLRNLHREIKDREFWEKATE